MAQVLKEDKTRPEWEWEPEAGKYECDFCGKKLTLYEDEIFSRKSTMDGFTIIFHSCSDSKCRNDMRVRI